MYTVRNPSTGAAIAEIALADEAAVDAACAAAATALPSWAAQTAAQRETLLWEAAARLEKRQAELIDLLVRETGATSGKAQAELRNAANMLRGIAGECRRLYGQVMPSDLPGALSFCIRRPKGVVAAIAPFNMPVMLALKKIALALAGGNCVIVKAAPEAALTSLALNAVFAGAGFPANVVHIIASDASAGEALVRHEAVRHVSFTGSTRAGRAVAQECARLGKTCTLELGGKSPLIVLADADLDYAASCAVFGLFTHQGQACMASSRVIVEAPVYEDFLARFLNKTERVRAGPADSPGVIVGPLIRDAQVHFIQERVDASITAGARKLIGGAADGAVYAPTILADVTPDMPVFRDELFGPVAAVSRAADKDEALALANDTPYGLSAAVHTRDLEAALAFINGLHVGQVRINGMTAGDEPQAPFGGLKASGPGREGGRWGVEEMTDLTWVSVETARLPFPF